MWCSVLLVVLLSECVVCLSDGGMCVRLVLMLLVGIVRKCMV